MIQVASKYERRVDTRSYDDKKKLFEGVSIFQSFAKPFTQTKISVAIIILIPILASYILKGL